jgi:ribosome-binding factor A
LGNRNRCWNRRAFGAHSHNASADILFEQALLGNEFESKKPFNPRADRKTLQLCRQVQRAVMQALAGECGDDLLRDLSVESVNPAGGAGHLLVHVIVPRAVSVAEVMNRLDDRSARLRSIVANSICRKRAPMLSFIAVPMPEGGSHVGDE